ncbi:DUF6338 family protein [Nocardia cyriacigeorgica]|uniref:DUF6338 family protein n=1 Tax=Nocardia cyriacigeorgica TaxID=135487 RepID=UPI000CE9B5E9|nr:DUF6338 family protein [Nocardia cyriacigeorgica]PPJ02291.1 hypothetical protein C5E43_27015 [Nocardia cyriacigeorgica]
MSLPQTVFQLLALVALAIPGITFSVARRRLVGPGTDEKDFSMRLARAVGVSVVLNCIYIAIGWPYLKKFWDKGTQGTPGYLHHPREAAAAVLVLAFAIPVFLALAGQIRFLEERTVPGDDRQWWKRLTRPYWEPIWHPAPNSWDANAPKLGGCYVVIRTDDGEWVGGYLPDLSGYVSTYPEPRDIFIPQPFHINDDGTLGEPLPDGRGLFVPLTGSERVYWFAPYHPPTPEASRDQPPLEAGQTPEEAPAPHQQ